MTERAVSWVLCLLAYRSVTSLSNNHEKSYHPHFSNEETEASRILPCLRPRDRGCRGQPPLAVCLPCLHTISGLRKGDLAPTKEPGLLCGEQPQQDAPGQASGTAASEAQQGTRRRDSMRRAQSCVTNANSSHRGNMMRQEDTGGFNEIQFLCFPAV